MRIDPSFNLGACVVWTSEVSDAPAILPPDLYDRYHAREQDMVKVWQFNFCDGQFLLKGEAKSLDVVNNNNYVRILAVRQGGPSAGKGIPLVTRETSSSYDK